MPTAAEKSSLVLLTWALESLLVVAIMTLGVLIHARLLRRPRLRASTSSDML